MTDSTNDWTTSNQHIFNGVSNSLKKNCFFDVFVF
jgi:hypothetical protein